MRIAMPVRKLFVHPPFSDSGRIERLYVIDLLRGLAALAILVWHYQHFFFLRAGQPMAADRRPLQPFYSILEPFYEQGLLAVSLFWMISGFVFCTVYIYHRATARAFIVNRIARLIRCIF